MIHPSITGISAAGGNSRKGRQKAGLLWSLGAVIALSATGVVQSARAATVTDLYQFTGGADGAGPSSALIHDNAGHLYGTAGGGGQPCDQNQLYGCGTVYRLDAPGKLTILHTFTGADGQGPTGLTFAHGYLYGNVYEGGTNDDGTLFSMMADGSDFRILHNFTGKDGYQPIANPLPAGQGGQFGITSFGGPGFDPSGPHPRQGKGVLYYLTAAGRMHVIHHFSGGTDGENPTTLVMDKAGNVFGTVGGGGACDLRRGCGLIFEYSPATATYAMIHTMSDTKIDGYNPKLGAVGPDGTVYGVATGGPHNSGTLFALTPNASSYAFTVLATLPNLGSGSGPWNAPTLADNGDLVGETALAMWGYRNGIMRSLGRTGPPPMLPQTVEQLLIGPDTTLYGVSAFGPQTTCTYITGVQDPHGCGYIFSYRLKSPQTTPSR